MIFASFNIKPYLAEYLTALFGESEPIPHVRFPRSEYLYHVTFGLMTLRPAGVPPEKGNITVRLPRKRLGKNPLHHNYISPESEKKIEAIARRLFFAHLHNFVDEQAVNHGEPICDSVEIFLKIHQIETVNLESLTKSYYRWREKVRGRIKKRKYNRRN